MLADAGGVAQRGGRGRTKTAQLGIIRERPTPSPLLSFGGNIGTEPNTTAFQAAVALAAWVGLPGRSAMPPPEEALTPVRLSRCQRTWATTRRGRYEGGIVMSDEILNGTGASGTATERHRR